MSLKLRRLAAAAALGLLVAALGCGPGGIRREVVHGKVTFKGQPVSAGQIRFLIDSMPTAMGQISKGAYRIDHLGGVPVGSGKVEIEGFEETKKVVFTSIDGKKTMEANQVLPAKYNEKSELKVDITAGGTNEKNFELTP
ncbi:MAG: hypothetical protein ACRC33_15430 [Gemmataceae bacterium]